MLLETHEAGAKDEELIRGLIQDAGGQLTSFHSELNIYHTTSREVALVHDDSVGGAPSVAKAAAALDLAAHMGSKRNWAPKEAQACQAFCMQQPWRVGCRVTAHGQGLGLLSAYYLARFERASVLPSTGRYLVLGCGGGFGNQLNEILVYMLAALLTDRILVVSPLPTETHADLAFDLRRYFSSTAFPFAGSPTIRNAVTAAEEADKLRQDDSLFARAVRPSLRRLRPQGNQRDDAAESLVRRAQRARRPRLQLPRRLRQCR